ncbi:hypothetical protein Daus18300_000768 [Diaporthe australafricana]|uniref:Uncharacterized protein n=1 Tax=Diaporthe australafricana TaxID=127596 RepID=A0ABR3Y384_9PEZI
MRLKAELVAPEKRDQAKVSRMLAELHATQLQGGKQLDGADDTIPDQGADQVEDADEEDTDDELVSQSPREMHQQVAHDRGHAQSSTKLQPYAGKYHETLRRGLLKAAENGTAISNWIKKPKPSSLGDFWARLRAELVAAERDQPKIKRMLDDFRASDQSYGGFTVAEEAEREKDEAQPKQNVYPCMDEAEANMEGHPDVDCDDDDDDVFVRRPRRRQRLLAKHQVEEDL